MPVKKQDNLLMQRNYSDLTGFSFYTIINKEKIMTLRRIIVQSLALALLLVTSSTIHAQEFSPTVIGSSGGDGKVKGITIMWTLGEVAVATLTNGENVLTQGFHQPPEGTTSAPLLTDALPGVSVRPNPVANELFVELPELGSKEAYLELVDMSGSRVMETTNQTGLQTLRLNVSELPVGAYIVRTRIGEKIHATLVTIER